MALKFWQRKFISEILNLFLKYKSVKINKIFKIFFCYLNEIFKFQV